MRFEQGHPGAGKSYRSVETSVARQSFREVVEEAALAGQRVVITRHGRPLVALVSLRDLDLLSERDAGLDQELIGRRAPSAGGVRLEEFAASIGIDQPSNDAPVPVDRIAEEAANEFLDDFLVPAIASQAREHASAILQQELGNRKEVSREDASTMKKRLLAALHSLAKGKVMA